MQEILSDTVNLVTKDEPYSLMVIKKAKLSEAAIARAKAQGAVLKRWRLEKDWDWDDVRDALASVGLKVSRMTPQHWEEARNGISSKNVPLVAQAFGKPSAELEPQLSGGTESTRASSTVSDPALAAISELWSSLTKQQKSNFLSQVEDQVALNRQLMRELSPPSRGVWTKELDDSAAPKRDKRKKAG